MPVSVVDVYESKDVTFIVLLYNIPFYELTSNFEFLDQQIIVQVVLHNHYFLIRLFGYDKGTLGILAYTTLNDGSWVGHNLPLFS